MTEDSKEQSGSGRRIEADISPTLSASGKRRWLYPDRRPGKEASRRKYLAIVLIAFYLVAPWIKIGSLPLLRMDVIARKVYLFGQSFAFSDGSYLIFIMLMAALGLFLVTALWGRVWCGFACPQTVFVEWIIRPIEELVEGKAHTRRVRDSQPFTFEKGARKTIKHFLFLTIAAVAANTFLAFFFDPAQLLTWITSSPAEHPGPFLFMLATMLAFYFDLGLFREQFCTFVCPYARFQSVMMDEDTPAVAYDYRRGEPRGKKASGDCIDCELCVRVCPTGIDIRKGLQLECIMCNRCIDACNTIMSSLKRPPNLISKFSLGQLEGKAGKVWRPRVILYSALLALIGGGFAFQLITRPQVDFNLTRAPGTTHIPVDEGHVGNLFYVRAVNLTNELMVLDLNIVTPADATLSCGTCSQKLKPFEERKFPVLISFPRQEAEASLVIEHVASRQLMRASLIIPD